MRSRIQCLVACLILGAPAIAEAGPLSIADGARVFGSFPALWNVRLSPDGQQVSALRQHEAGIPIATVIDLKTGQSRLVLAGGEEDVMHVQSCDWANESRLLCRFFGITEYASRPIWQSRLVAVNSDGSQAVILAELQLEHVMSFLQDDILDRLPDDREHILMQLREGNAAGVHSVDIYTNETKEIERPRDPIRDWKSDGRGNLRVRREITETESRWYYRKAGASRWKELHEDDPGDHTKLFHPQGFGKEPNQLLVWDKHEGRFSVFGLDLENELSRELVYSHPEVDLDGIVALGKYGRYVGVSFSTDGRHYEYFDETVRRIQSQVQPKLPGMALRFDGESWDRRFYLIYASSKGDAGTYYRFDSKADTLLKIMDAYPRLEKIELVRNVPIEYPSKDGVTIRSHIMIPEDGGEGPRPTIVMPRGNPLRIDEWDLDWLGQFLAARGYVVLHANYRGSAGYGNDWADGGVFRNWQRATTDLEFGARHLIEEGIADSDRICTLGWGHGGYAALMSAIEYPERYRCAVSVAGVTDPLSHVEDAWGPLRMYRESQIGRDRKDLRASSPRRRADEIQAPVLLVHGKSDLYVRSEQSETMEKELRDSEKKVELIEYDGATHSIRDQDYQIDLLVQIGKFLDTNLAPQGSKGP